MFQVVLKDGTKVEGTKMDTRDYVGGFDLLTDNGWIYIGGSNIKSIRYIP